MLGPSSWQETVRMGILDKVKNLLSQNADKVETVINKAGEFVDEQTQGNYSDAIHKLQDAASNVVGMSDQQS